MRSFILAALLVSSFCAPAFADASLEVFLGDLDVRARADLPGFSTRISAHFGVPLVTVNSVLGSVRHPADAFMIFQLALSAGVPHERVMHIYRERHGQGWGDMALALGIKAGSPEFHALKRGDFRFEFGPRGDHGPGPRGRDDDDDDKGHGKGKDKGHGKR